MLTRAITRKPGEDFAKGLTSRNLGTPILEKARLQHDEYCRVLWRCGLEVTTLDPLEGFPDAPFVEDMAVTTARFAVLTRPKPVTRQGESESIRKILEQIGPRIHYVPRGWIDGGDVFRLGELFFIGLSGRTDLDGVEVLRRMLEHYGYPAAMIPVGDAGLHLRSCVNPIGENALIMTSDFVVRNEFRDYELIVVDEDERPAANTLFVNNRILTPKGYPKTLRRLGSLGFPVVEIDISEFEKMDGGLTCLSLRF